MKVHKMFLAVKTLAVVTVLLKVIYDMAMWEIDHIKFEKFDNNCG